jgi:HSP20 family protein
MPRETGQQDKRTQSKGKGAQSGQTAQNARGKATDRQASIQTGRDLSRTSGQTDQGQASRQIASSQLGQQGQQGQQREQNRQNQQNQPSEAGQSMQQTSNATRRGMSAPIRGGATSPFDLMQRMSEDMDRLLEQFGFGRAGFGLTPNVGSLVGSDLGGRSSRFGGGDSLWAPQVEVGQRGDRLVVRADLPGVNKDDVHVEVDDGVLTISGERRNEQQEERDGVFRSERSYGSFYRAIPLPEGLSADQCDAKFNDGVLEVSLPVPKQEERTSRRVQIR